MNNDNKNSYNAIKIVLISLISLTIGIGLILLLLNHSMLYDTNKTYRITVRILAVIGVISFISSYLYSQNKKLKYQKVSSRMNTFLIIIKIISLIIIIPYFLIFVYNSFILPDDPKLPSRYP